MTTATEYITTLIEQQPISGTLVQLVALKNLIDQEHTDAATDRQLLVEDCARTLELMKRYAEDCRLMYEIEKKRTQMIERQMQSLVDHMASVESLRPIVVMMAKGAFDEASDN